MRMIDANALMEFARNQKSRSVDCNDIARFPKIDLESLRPKGRWVLKAHEETCNYRWNVTAECSECHHDKGEIYAGFFTGFPKDLAEDTILDCAKSVKLDNFCPSCGADMRGEESK